MLQNARVTAFTVSELLRENQQAVKINSSPPPPRLWLIWMFHSRQLNHRISKIQERALRLVYKDNKLTLNDLLELDNPVTIHRRNLQILQQKYSRQKTV